MRAAVFHEFGGPEVVRIEEVAQPVPGPRDVLIKVEAAALNHLDLWVRRGLPIETTMPHIGGADLAGTIVEAGSGARRTLVGQRVVVDPSLACGACEWCARGEQSLCLSYKILGEHTNGGFAEWIAVPADNIYPLPRDYDANAAAAAPLVFLTAWRALKARARLQAGESVLITGASGGVATAALQIARHLGAHVSAVTTGEHAERVRSLGAQVVYDRNDPDYAKRMWTDTRKRGFDVIVDSVGSATWSTNLRNLARLGRLVVYGATTGAAAETDLRVLFWKQASIIGTTMASRTEFRDVMDLVFSGVFQPVIDRVLPLEQARQAHELLEAGEQFGKIVLRP